MSKCSRQRAGPEKLRIIERRERRRDGRTFAFGRSHDRYPFLVLALCL